jgi:dipeptidase
MLGVDELLVEGGEALTVVDKTEAWMFHILPDDTGTSAVWCAQRVPDSHITIVANAFVIRKVDPSDPDFMFSSNMWDVAERMGWWSQDDGLLDFKMTFGAIRSRPNYSNRRVWRILSLAAPSANLPSEVDALGDGLPFSVPVGYFDVCCGTASCL